MTTDVEKIKTLSSLQECHDFYDSPAIQNRIIRARNNQVKFCENAGDDASIANWALDWANNKKRSDESALQLENDRKTCLSLLYRMHDLSDAKDDKFVSEIEDKFGAERISNIIALFVPLDQANARYVMTLPGSIEPGMYWFAKKHAEDDSEIATKLEGYTGFATINKRLLWYTSTFKLGRAIELLLDPIVE